MDSQSPSELVRQPAMKVGVLEVLFGLGVDFISEGLRQILIASCLHKRERDPERQLGNLSGLLEFLIFIVNFFGELV